MDTEELLAHEDRLLEVFSENGLDGLDAGAVLTAALAHLIEAAPEGIRYELLERTLAAIRGYVEGDLT